MFSKSLFGVVGNRFIPGDTIRVATIREQHCACVKYYCKFMYKTEALPLKWLTYLAEML